MSTSVSVSTVANAPRSAVWEVLADFENIADYTSQVRTSVSTSEQATGMGATRACDLAPMGSTNERITEFVPEARLGVALYDVKGLPVKGSDTVFELEEIDSTTTRLTFNAQVEAKGGPLAGMVGKRLESRLPKGAQELIEDLAAAAEAAASK